MKLLQVSSKEEPPKNDRRRDVAERRRREREIDEEWKRRLHKFPTNLRLCGF